MGQLSIVSVGEISVLTVFLIANMSSITQTGQMFQLKVILLSLLSAAASLSLAQN